MFCSKFFAKFRFSYLIFQIGILIITTTTWKQVAFAYNPILRSLDLLSVRSMGMGRAYTAIANDEITLQSNPAGIGIKNKLFQIKNYDSIFYFLPIKMGYSENLFGSLTIGTPNIKKYYAYDSKLSYSLDFYLPTDFAYIGDFWAISFFTRGFANVFSNEDENSENIYAQGKIFSQINLGFKLHSFSFLSDEDFHIGIAGKLIYFLQSEKNQSNDEVEESFRELNETFTTNSLIDFRKNLANKYAEIANIFEGIAIGLDFGLLWEIHIRDTEHQINLGIMLENAPTYAFSINVGTEKIFDLAFPSLCKRYFNTYEILPESVDVDEYCQYRKGDFEKMTSAFFRFNGKFGIAYLLPSYWGGFFSDTMIAFDVHRVGDQSYSFADMYHVGISTTVFDMVDRRTGYSYRMNISVGVSQNQFNAGYLIHLNKYEIGYNYYREEVIEVDKAVSRHLLTFAFYF